MHDNTWCIWFENNQSRSTVLSLIDVPPLINRHFQTKNFADDNFKFDDNSRKFSKWVENTVGKGEIAHYEQCLLCPQCFQKTCTADK